MCLKFKVGTNTTKQARLEKDEPANTNFSLVIS